MEKNKKEKEPQIPEENDMKKNYTTYVVLAVVLIIVGLIIVFSGAEETPIIVENSTNNITEPVNITINSTTDTNITTNTTNSTYVPDIYDELGITRPGHHDMFVMFDYKIAFLGYDINQTILAPNETFEITYYWKALDDMDKDYTVFVHFTDEKNKILFLGDYSPTIATTKMRTNRIYEIKKTYTIPDQINQINNIKIGWYYPTDLIRLETTTGNSIYIVRIMVMNK